MTNLIPHAPELADDILYERWTTTPRRRATSSFIPSVDLPVTDVHPEAYDVLRRLVGTGTPLRLNGAELVGAGPRCRFVTEGRLAVSWDGHVSPCLALLHYHVSNVNNNSLLAIWQDDGYRAFRTRVRNWEFAPCIDCGGCDLRETNEEDCTGDQLPRCGECLWAPGLVQCP